MKLSVATFAIATSLAFNAQAIEVHSTNWGPHGEYQEALGQARNGFFEDTYLFTVTEGQPLFNTTVSNNNGTVKNLIDGMVFLFFGASSTPLGSFAFDGTTGDVPHSFGSLGAGGYHYLVSGKANGTRGGSYSLTSVSAIPEPQTYALLLAGLGVIGFVARRRRPQA